MKQTQDFNPVQTAVKCKKEWTPAEFKGIEKSIAKHFSQRVFLRFSTGQEMKVTRVYNSFTQIDNILGLAYTSSGMFACYGICNVDAHFDEDNIYSYSYFVIGNNDKHYAILQDKDENELTIEL